MEGTPDYEMYDAAFLTLARLLACDLLVALDTKEVPYKYPRYRIVPYLISEKEKEILYVCTVLVTVTSDTWHTTL